MINSWPSNTGLNHRSGVTLADVLVSLGVIGVLMAVTLPAVQRARENARQLQCRDNLRQFGIATQNHLATRIDKFPYTATNGSDSQGQVLLASVSPHQSLLDFLDLSDLRQSLRSDPLIVNETGVPPRFTDPTLQQLLSIRIPVFLCPSDVQRPGATNYRANMGFGPGIYGPGPPVINGFAGNVSGAFVHGRNTRPFEFRDGFSNTILFSERLIGDGDSSRFAPQADFYFASTYQISTADDAVQACGSLADPNPIHASFCGWSWWFGGWNSTWYNHILPPNSRIPDCSEGTYAMAGGGSGVYSARSFHIDGVNAVFADGSTRFVSNQIDLLAWRSLSTRRGEENDSE
jgi:Tfp pilus assembly protein PilE